MADIESSTVGMMAASQQQERQVQHVDGNNNNNKSHQDPRRYQAWVGLFVFSVVALAAQLSTPVSSSSQTRSFTEKWVLSVLSVSLSLSFIGVVLHFYIININNTKAARTAEGILAGLLLILWVGGLPSIMKPTNCMALCGPGVHNTNLYFSSWAALACSLYIWGHYAHELVVAAKRRAEGEEENDNANNSAETTTASPRLSRTKTPSMWYALLATSIVILTSSIQYHTSYCIGGGTTSTPCTRNTWAMSLGSTSCLLSAMMSLFLSYPSFSQRLLLNNNNNNNKTRILVQLGTSTLLGILYTFGIAFLTFGNSGPGIVIGNLYFSTWIGFVLSILLTFDALQEYVSAMKRNKNNSGARTTTTRRDSQQELLRQQQRQQQLLLLQQQQQQLLQQQLQQQEQDDDDDDGIYYDDDDVNSATSSGRDSDELTTHVNNNNNNKNSTVSRTMDEEEKDIETGSDTDENDENKKTASKSADPPAAYEA